MEIILLALVAILIGLNIYLYRLISKEERVYTTKLTILTIKVDTLVEAVQDLQHDMIDVLKDVHKLKGVCREHSHKLDKHAERLEP